MDSIEKTIAVINQTRAEGVIENYILSSKDFNHEKGKRNQQRTN